jgi:hypothetical protein
MHIGLRAKLLGAQVLFVFFASQAWAAPCVIPPATPQAIAQFKANPKGIIAPDTDTRTVEASVRELAGTDATLAKDLVQLAKDATPRYKTAIAAGLAQAAVACMTIDQQAGLAIQQAVAEFDDNEFQASFAAVAGDLSTAATDAAAASASSSVGSVVIVNPTSSRGTRTNPGGGGPTAFVLFPSALVSINSTTATSSSTTSSSSNPISPVR